MYDSENLIPEPIDSIQTHCFPIRISFFKFFRNSLSLIQFSDCLRTLAIHIAFNHFAFLSGSFLHSHCPLKKFPFFAASGKIGFLRWFSGLFLSNQFLFFWNFLLFISCLLHSITVELVILCLNIISFLTRHYCYSFSFSHLSHSYVHKCFFP